VPRLARRLSRRIPGSTRRKGKMKRQWVTALGVGLTLVAFVTSSAFAGQKGSMGEGGGMRQGVGRSPRGEVHPAEWPLITFMLQHREALKLTEEQVGKLEAIRAEFQKKAEERSAEIRKGEADLQGLLSQEKVDLGRVEETLKRIGVLETQHRFERIKAIEQGKSLLSDEQRKILDSLIQKGMAPSRMQGRGGMMGGLLVFLASDPLGKPLLGEGTKYIDLVIRDVAGVKERVFRWDLPL
jgi:Spy/CpxP family protein refolding chaperone